MPKVYVVQEVPGRNILPAKRYGDLTALLPANSNIVLSAGPTVRKLKRLLTDFNDEDYLLLLGDPAAIGLACTVAASMNRGKYKILKWDREQRDYYPVEIDIYHTGGEDDG